MFLNIFEFLILILKIAEVTRLGKKNNRHLINMQNST